MSKTAFMTLLAAMTVQVDGSDPRLYELDEFKRAVDSADTPARVFLPSLDGDVHTVEVSRLGSGVRQQVNWTVRDLLMYKPAEEGMGWLEVDSSLDDYCHAYVSAIAGAAFAGYRVLSYTMQVDVFTYGVRSYYGAMVTLSVRENYC